MVVGDSVVVLIVVLVVVRVVVRVVVSSVGNGGCDGCSVATRHVGDGGTVTLGNVDDPLTADTALDKPLFSGGGTTRSFVPSPQATTTRSPTLIAVAAATGPAIDRHVRMSVLSQISS